MKFKKIIDDQIKYIFNVVLVLRCEYKMMITVLSKDNINKLTTNIRRLLRNKIGISNTAPNIILSHKELYNLVDLYYRQEETQVVNLLKRLNNPYMVRKITEIRVKQLQDQEALYDNPLKIWNYNQINAFKNNIIAKILCLIKDIGLGISTIGLDNKYKFTSYKGKQKFYNIFEEKDFRKYKDQFKKKQNNEQDQKKMNLNSYQIYTLGFITPIILFGIYYIIKKYI